jgi:RNA 2',3'-cyclic 3'-phosphodiesterase
MRLFVALDIPGEIRAKISAYVDELRRIAPEEKWVRPESYHLTLKFIGEWKRDVGELISALEQVQATHVSLSFSGCGFFPNPRSPRVFWVGIHADEHLPMLARHVDESCSSLGIERENRDFTPHLTLARTRSGSPRPKRDERPSSTMRHLAERIAGMPEPDFGTMLATEFYLYESKLSSSGARYFKLKSFSLRGSG